MIMRSQYFLLLLFLLPGLTACAAKQHSDSDHHNSETKHSERKHSEIKPIEIKPLHKINIEHDAVKNGIFDISVEYDDKGIGWMAYSRVKLPKYVETRIAKSTDKGKTWQFVSTVNPSKDGQQNIIDKKNKTKKQKGVWRNETPSLLYDPEDKPARRWKLFYQHYLSKPPYKKGNSLFAHGWIEYRYAKSPEGPWSKPVRLFGSKKNKCHINPNKLHKDLKKNAFYNEIGTISVAGVIYLSVDASTTDTGLGDWSQRKIVLFSSRDHGKNWNYVGVLTDFDDAGKFGYLIFTGSSLVREGKKIYLLITPAGKKGLFVKNRGHDGTYIVEFEDISKARLKRDKKGKLIVLKMIKPDRDMHSGGLADYDEQNTQGGILFSQLSSNAKHRPEFFQVYNTGKGIQ